MESFLGFANFYRRFIHNFSHIAKTIKQVERKEGIGIDRRTSIDIQRIKREDNEPAYTLPSKEER